MTCKPEEPRSGNSLSNVYEIPGEPAIVIDGVPSMDGLDNPNPPPVTGTEAEAETVTVTVTVTVTPPVFGEWMEGRAVQKLFGEQVYTGTVTAYDKGTGWFRVVYVDGDFEDLEWHELQEILVPLDITIPLKTLALKRLKKNESHARKTTENHVSSRSRQTRRNAKSANSG